MPRSKRSRIVPLTKTGSKGKELKNKLVQSLRDALDEYDAVYVLNFENLRASLFREVRMDWKESRLYMGKIKVAQIALGRIPEEEYKDNLRHISQMLQGNMGLLFTSRDKSVVEHYFNEFSRKDFAKAGTLPDETIIIPPGPLPKKFPVSMMDELRKLGMVVEVENAQLALRTPFTAATSGQPLTPEQAKVLTKLDMKIVDFKIKLEAMWANNDFIEY